MTRQSLPRNILAALQSGDAGPLIQFHRNQFGDARMMADGDDTGDSGDDGSDDDEDTGSAGDSDGKADDKELDPRVKALSDENARRRNEAKALKQQNEELAAKLKAIEDKDKGELEKTASALTELKAQAEKLTEDNLQLRIQNAFLMDNKHNWANPKTALRLADLSEVEIDDEGNVSGLREALDKLAKAEPYLLAKKADGDDEDDELPVTGQPVGKKAKGNPSRDKLLDKYPALRR